MAFGDSLKATGGPATALLIFFVFYLSCVAVNWAFYARRKSLLNTPTLTFVPEPAA